MTRERQQERYDTIEAIIGRSSGFAIQLRGLIGTEWFEVVYDAVRESTLADLEAKQIEIVEAIKKLTD